MRDLLYVSTFEYPSTWLVMMMMIHEGAETQRKKEGGMERGNHDWLRFPWGAESHFFCESSERESKLGKGERERGERTPAIE